MTGENVLESITSAGEKITLPLDDVKQRAVVGHMILQPVFFQQCKSRIKPEWFNQAPLSRVYGAVLSFWDKYNRVPTVQELIGWRDILQFAPAERATLINTINLSIAETKNYGLDVIRNELTYWLSSYIYRKGVLDSKKYYDSGDFDKCFKSITQNVKEMNESKFSEDVAVRFSDPHLWLPRIKQRYDNALTFGLKAMDDALMPEGMDSGAPGESASLLLGDTTLLLAPSNVGKTTALITIARHNIMRGRDVLWFSHEGVDEDLRFKMACAVVGLDQFSLLKMSETESGLATLTSVMRLIDERLDYIPWNYPGMTVEDLIPVIEKRQDERRAKNDGKGYDLLVDDYPGKLQTEYARGGKLEARTKDAIVYDNFVQLGLKHKFHILAAIQTNREGSKSNRDDTRLLTMEDVRESWDTMTMATNVITMNRDAKASIKNRLTYLFAKSRSSRVGRAVVCKTNYAASLTHSENLGATWYYGSQSLSDHVDEFIRRFKGKEIPTEEINSLN